MIRLLLIVSLVATACTKSRKKTPDPKPETKKAEIQSDDQDLLDVKVQIVGKSGRLSVTKIPENAVLDCAINKERVDECQTGMNFPLPKIAGIYTFFVVAKREGNPVAIGDAKFNVGLPNSSARIVNSDKDVNQKYLSDLTLVLDESHFISGKKFQNGMALNRGVYADIKFKFLKVPTCKAKIRCLKGRLQQHFKPLCSTGNSQIFRPGMMAKGLQYLRVQAECGDKVGEPLLLYWYGVNKDYRFMALDYLHVKGENKYIFNLMRMADCPAQNKLKYECRSSAGAQFAACENDNVVTNPGQGFAIRPVCSGRTFQALTL